MLNNKALSASGILLSIFLILKGRPCITFGWIPEQKSYKISQRKTIFDCHCCFLRLFFSFIYPRAIHSFNIAITTTQNEKGTCGKTRLKIKRKYFFSFFKNWCILLHLVIHYLMLANYFWMFCEGLHLHLVLVVVINCLFNLSPPTGSGVPLKVKLHCCFVIRCLSRIL